MIKHLQGLHSTPARVLSTALTLVFISASLLSVTGGTDKTALRHYAVPQNYKSETIQTTKSASIIANLRTARDVLASGVATSDSFVFSEKRGYALVGRTVTEAASEFSLPTTRLSYIDPDGIETLVTDKPVEYSLLSPDGTKTIYTTSDKHTYLYDNATKTERLLTTHAAFLPDLCRDNNKIVYKKLPPGWQMGQDFVGSPGLAILDITTGVERLITTYDSTLPPGSPGFSAIGENSYAPTFSPDCQSVLFFGGGMINSMFIVNADGTSKTQLTNIGQTSITADTIPGISDSPLWSPDGTTFIYESDGKIIKADIDTKQRTLKSKVTKIADGIAPQWVDGREGVELGLVQQGQSLSARSRVGIRSVAQ